MVFRNGGTLNRYEKWTFDNRPLEVVNRFCYLGFVFTPRLSINIGTKHLIAKAKTASFSICRVLQKCNNMPRNVFFRLFDAKVQSILLYSSEIWGMSNPQGLESVHTQACKRFLGVPTRTPNNMVYSDLQRFPISICSSMRVLKYWTKILGMDENRLPKLTYNMLLSLDKNGFNCWASDIRKFLSKIGFQYVWDSQCAHVATSVLSHIKQRLMDIFVQEWECCVRDGNHYILYRIIKKDFFDPDNFSHIDVYCYRKSFIQMRLDVLPINGSIYRYSASDALKMCPVCKVHIENLQHFLKDCPLYSKLREDICPIIASLYLEDIVSVKSEAITKVLGKFVFLALKMRSRVIETLTNE